MRHRGSQVKATCLCGSYEGVLEGGGTDPQILIAVLNGLSNKLEAPAASIPRKHPPLPNTYKIDWARVDFDVLCITDMWQSVCQAASMLT